ncbi:hypothetical protein [Flavobacterium soyae]|uniref:hypothetical protein n=1 Tax=Flavobacterium soyae TaxID=2903098 RepID=UPI001E585B75|nr:hypothetical protein [Flavobacterium soyae]MCD9576245.1 hypothetical protein [Flavobacterium soyae]
MKHRHTHSKNENSTINDAAKLWKFLVDMGGIDSNYYDKEIFNAEDPELNLYALLGIPNKFESIEQNLAAGGVTIETFLQVLLKALHPYSQMMSEICIFFEKYQLKYAKNNIQIKFNFDISDNESFKFNLENFRESLKQIETVEQNIFYYEITINKLSVLYEILNSDSKNVSSNEARLWIEAYFIDNEKGIFSLPNVPAPITGHVRLDNNLNALMDIWRSFVGSCRMYGTTVKDFRNAVRSSPKSSINRDDNLLADKWLLYYAELDYWPKIFLEQLFGKIQEIKNLHIAEHNAAFDKFSEKLDEFLSSLNQNRKTVKRKQLTEKLLDLLSLPIWKYRYELYAVWILTVIDRVFTDYEVDLHHEEGKLALLFKETHIATIKTARGLLELWSEVRSPLKNPSSKKRVSGIQPDYRIFYSGDLSVPQEHLTAIEVKQYRRSSNKNFREALNDYAAGLPKAFIFLVNYGPVSKNISLDYPERSIFLGQIKPSGVEVDNFVKQLSIIMPKIDEHTADAKDYLKTPELVIFYDCPIDLIYVDVSGSLNTIEYKTFLQTILNDLVRSGQIQRLIAVDSSIQKEWLNPDLNSVKELIKMDYNGGTDFGRIVRAHSQKTLIITDSEGYKDCVKSWVILGCCIVYEVGEVKFFKINPHAWENVKT